jgi:hypothetical protein
MSGKIRFMNPTRGEDSTTVQVGVILDQFNTQSPSNMDHTHTCRCSHKPHPMPPINPGVNPMPIAVQGIQGIQGPRGPHGLVGPMGPQGPAGSSIVIRDRFSSIQELENAHPTGLVGDGYVVNDELFIWSETQLRWISCGRLVGVQGTIGPRGLQGTQGIQGTTGIQGPHGAMGLRGVPGHGLHVLGRFESELELRTVCPLGNSGDAYLVGTELFVWDHHKRTWINTGDFSIKFKGSTFNVSRAGISSQADIDSVFSMLGSYFETQAYESYNLHLNLINSGVTTVNFGSLQNIMVNSTVEIVLSTSQSLTLKFESEVNDVTCKFIGDVQRTGNVVTIQSLRPIIRIKRIDDVMIIECTNYN